MLRREWGRRHGDVFVKSGHVYTFRYQAWQHDKQPTVLMMYAVSGIHPRTGHQHRYFQGINFTYIPRSHRIAFAKLWMEFYKYRIGDPEKINIQNIRPDTLQDFFTWEKVKKHYPILQPGIRRYFYSPAYYIQGLTEIKPENMKAAIESTWAKDFSSKVRNIFARTVRKLI